MAEIFSFDTEQEWLEARRKYVTSTEVPAIFGQHPRLTAFELASIKLNPALDTFEGNERTEWGHALESAIAEQVWVRHGVYAKYCGRALAVVGSCAASGDFIITSADHTSENQLCERFHRLGEGMLEIKNVDSLVYKREWTKDEMPGHIEIQLQAEMLCWDKRWGVVAALVGGNRLELYVRERDEKVCELIAHRAAIFMADLATGKLPPAVLPEDAAMVIALNSYAEPGKVYNAEKDAELSGFIEAYKSCKREAADAEKEAASFKALIFDRIKDAESVIGLQQWNLSAKMRAPVEVAAHTRAGFRDLRITERKERGREDQV